MSDNSFEFLIVGASVISASIAAISGFGIGSILTPLLGTHYDMKLAVAAVSVPHLVATTLRLYFLRDQINKEVLIKFGTMSAIGGLGGALLQQELLSPHLVFVLAAVLIFVGVGSVTGFSRLLRVSPKLTWLAGIASGALGGIVGNQGGIRSAALLTIQMSKMEMVATATAIGVVVDLARMPVYFSHNAQGLKELVVPILLATVGCAIGTLFGKDILSRISDRVFRIVVGILLLGLGLYLLFEH